APALSTRDGRRRKGCPRSAPESSTGLRLAISVRRGRHPASLSAEGKPMAHVIVRRVRRELESIRDASQAVKHLLRDVLEAIERDPSAFAELQEIPERVRAIAGVTVRKANVTHGPHDYRLVFLHFRPDGG